MRYLIFKIIGFAFVVAAVFVFNAMVDSAGIQAELPNDEDRKHMAGNPAYADILRARRAVQVLKTAPIGIEWQQKLEKGVKFWLAMEGRSDCYVLGSSRVYQARHGNLKFAQKNCQSLINLHGPTFDTFYDLMFMGILARSTRTKHIIVGVPPWLLNPLPARLAARIQAQGGVAEYVGSFRFMKEKEVVDSVFFGNHSFMKEKEVVDSVFFGNHSYANRTSTLQDLLSLRYVLINTVRLYDYASGTNAAASGDQTPADSDGIAVVNALPVTDIDRYIRTDGSMAYRAAIYKPWTPPQTQDAAAIRSLFKPMESMLRPPYKSEGTKQVWIDAIRYMHTQGIRVTLFPVPFNPWTYASCAVIADKSPICAALKVMPGEIEDIAKQSGATVLTGYDPRAYDLNWENFVDYWHIMASGIEKLPPD